MLGSQKNVGVAASSADGVSLQKTHRAEHRAECVCKGTAGRSVQSRAQNDHLLPLRGRVSLQDLRPSCPAAFTSLCAARGVALGSSRVVLLETSLLCFSDRSPAASAGAASALQGGMVGNCFLVKCRFCQRKVSVGILVLGILVQFRPGSQP